MTDRGEDNLKLLLRCLRDVTLPLVTLNDSHTAPVRSASGFVVARDGRYFLLSAAHAIQSGQWFIEWNTSTDGSTPPILIPLRSTWSLLETIDLGSGDSERVDFAWAEVDFQALVSQIEHDPIFKAKAIRLPTYYKGPWNHVPTTNGVYAYSAYNLVELEDHRSVLYLSRSASMEFGMDYVGEQSGVYRFRLDQGHKGHVYYHGASGAPIADSAGMIVSMLISGSVESDELFGVPLHRFEALVGRIS